MKISLLTIGKTNASYLATGIKEYEKRLQRFINFELKSISDIKNARKLSPAEIKNKEGQLLLKNIKSNDFVILLDERGKTFSSISFAEYLQKQMNQGVSNITFVVGGAYGFSEAIYKRANAKISLSKMTFSHQIIRLIFVEQIYRAYAIINHHPYHNE